MTCDRLDHLGFSCKLIVSHYILFVNENAFTQSLLFVNDFSKRKIGIVLI